MTARRELLIVGTSGLATELAQLARRIDPRRERWPEISYVAESADSLSLTLPYGTVRYLDADLARRETPCDVALGIGHPGPRRRVALALAQRPCFEFPNLVHPTVELDPDWVRLGRGNVVTQGVIMTCDIAIGDFNLFNWNVTVGHNARIGSYNVLNPATSVSGWVRIEDGCLLGTGCRILERLSVASDVRIGAGAVVIRSIDEPGVTCVGVPAAIRRP